MTQPSVHSYRIRSQQDPPKYFVRLILLPSEKFFVYSLFKYYVVYSHYNIIREHIFIVNRSFCCCINSHFGAHYKVIYQMTRHISNIQVLTLQEVDNVLSDEHV